MTAPILHLESGPATLWHGDCIETMRLLPDCSVDAVVTDPPYGLGFMGKDWDDLPPGVDFAVEALRVLKPGGHLLAFGGTRTWHRLAVAVEDAGFEIRDSIAWLYGSGFPKSLDVAKAITSTELGHGGNSGAQRRATMGADYVESGILGNRDGAGRRDTGMAGRTLELTESGKPWEGWGTALKPAFEPVVVARKPLAGTVAANVLEHGTGALNIAATRIGDGSESVERVGEASQEKRYTEEGGTNFAAKPGVRGGSPDGRWPTNVVLDESQAAALDAQSGTLTSGMMHAGQPKKGKAAGILGEFKPQPSLNDTYGDSGGLHASSPPSGTRRRRRPRSARSWMGCSTRR